MPDIVKIRSLPSASDLSEGDYAAIDNSTDGLRKVALGGIISDLKSALSDLSATVNGGTILVPETKTLSDCTTINFYIDERTGNYIAVSNARGRLLPLNDAKKVSITANASYGTQYAFLANDSCSAGESAPIVGGTLPVSMSAGQSVSEITIPSGARYLYFRYINNDGYNMFPSSIVLYMPDSSGGGLVDRVEDLEIFDISSPTNGQIITYDNTSKKWKNTDNISTDLSELTKLSNITFVDGYSIVSTNGGIQSESGKSYAEIAVVPGTSIKGWTRGGSSITNGAAFYNAAGGYVSGSTNPATGDNWEYEFTVPASAVLLRISCTSSYKSSFTCYKMNPIDEIDALRKDAVMESDYNADMVSLNKGYSAVFGTNVYDSDFYRVGSMYVENGVLKEGINSYRLSTKVASVFQMNEGDTIGLTSYTNRRYFLAYSANGTSWTQGTWTTSDTVLENDGYYAICIEDTTQTAITDISAILAQIKYENTESFYRKTEKAVNETIPELEDFKNYFIVSSPFSVNDFRIGTMYVENNLLKEASSTYRVSSKSSKPVHLVKGDIVGLSTYNDRRYLLYYSANGTSWTQGSWTTVDTIISADGYYAVLIEDVDQTTVTDVSTLFNILTYSSGSGFIEKTERRLSALEKGQTNPKFAHFSFDDVQYCMQDITANAETYDSIFDNPFFALLKDFHELYGTLFSLYLFTHNIANYTSAFADEFSANADWLKFGLHANYSTADNYANTTAEQALADYQGFVTNIIRITGTRESIDKCPRLSNFKGNLVSLLAMRDAPCGITGALSSYSASSESYYFDADQNAYIKNHGKLIDHENHLTFYKTSMPPFEATSFASSITTYEALSNANAQDYFEVFVHEYGVYTSSYELVQNVASQMRTACDYAVSHGYTFVFPMWL